MKVRTSLAAAALVAAPLAPVVIAAPAQAAWTCSDGVCRAISHKSPDDGYDDAILVRCGANLIQYSLAEGQNSQAVGCNDVNQVFIRSGHSLNCQIGSGWYEIAENAGSTGFWTNFTLGGSGSTWLCVDAWYGTIGGGSGGGSGGGGTWRQTHAGGNGGGGTW